MIRAVIEQYDPIHWSPTSTLDYAAVIMTSVSWVAIAVALFLLWQTTPVRRGAVFLLVAAIGYAVGALGNLVEDGFGADFGVLLFLVGLMIAAVATIIAGVSALTVRHPLRWTGLFLIAYVAGGGDPELWGVLEPGVWLLLYEFVSTISLLGLGLWLLLYQRNSNRTKEFASPQAHA
jgi:hypothetical protein